MSDTVSTQSATGPSPERMLVRRVPFSYTAPVHSAENAQNLRSCWNAAQPEFSHIVNAASVAMPYLEPYLIRTMRQARDLIKDEALIRDLDLYVAQEATHFRQHRKFNDTLIAKGYHSIEPFEERLKQDYASFGERRSLRFNLAYAEGFESMALAIGQMLIEDREYLFGHSDPSVASLVLWHFVEEIEHKNVTFDVFEHLYGSYAWRIFGLACATGHIFWRIGQGYRALLKEDGLWRNLKSRRALARMLGRIFKSLVPKFLRILKPGYHPSQIADPSWGLAWAALYRDAPERVAALDTTRLHEAQPV